MKQSGSIFVPETSVTAELVIKKSRFICSLYPIDSGEEANLILEEIQFEHKSASHHCFAYTVSWTVPTERFSDAGEPSGTAGRPILEVIRRRCLRNALIVVTRYFGGVLLGANGLTRAYAEGAALAVDAGVLLRQEWMNRIDVVCDYGALGKVEYELTQRNFTLFDKQYAEDVRFRLWVASEAAEELITELQEWTSGRIQVTTHAAARIGIRPDGSFQLPSAGGEITPE